jgi:hypothetical protein
VRVRSRASASYAPNILSRVSLTDWIISLHVLSAVALVGGMTALWALVLATRGTAEALPGSLPQALARPAVAALVAGIFGTVVFGIWLAIDLDAYHPWDPWIVASLVLWVVTSWLGSSSGRAFEKVAAAGPDARDWWRRGVRLQGGSSAAALLVLILMIWKPGA